MNHDIWYLSIRGEKRGPFSNEQLKEILSTSQAKGNSLLIWKEGMSTWLPPKEIDELSELLPKTQDSPNQQITEMPAPSKPSIIDDKKTGIIGSKEPEQSVGLSRLGFNLLFYLGLDLILGLAAYVVLRWIVLAPFGLFSIDSSFVLWAPIYPLLLVLGLTLIFFFRRLQNAGYSGWRVFTLLIPFYNLWTFYILVCGGSNFKKQKRFGTSEAVFITFFLSALSIQFWLINTQGKLSSLLISETAINYAKAHSPTVEESKRQAYVWAKSLNKQEREEVKAQWANLDLKKSKQKALFKRLGIQKLLPK